MDFDRSIFMQDILTPDQFFDRIRNVLYRQPEKRLLYAILFDAIHCFQAYLLANKTHQKRLYTEAAAWLFGDDTTWHFSFLNICDLLDLDAGYLRIGITQWREHTIKRAEMGKNPPKRRDAVGEQVVAMLLPAHKGKTPASP
ncbi:MAG: hypothetical protein A3C84_01720 [Candidatus Ryanbacteria bacterium RIFCSPHIGHO2_02_FULL_48_12]|uniref:Uncharacterized protein n=1 Tax=Candidatus Ryanbacteria bacterium RIFCSPHIGHO2_01_FULL_48_27 TaxID=1802115 RepID=A0A1G2G7H9_9BACT|nr:MAG: hypothetical protein A2756_06455 [Candidatus Ryanbacteria bacterium RIFCSPHIGHO2_01_FULL_48_27]OGZ49198.1 MAG: hypothetical protein A3C84_01720 [Candidatus Ryanbacteria bacterium RIFCSPHIGHO2_02_FULL_48_12]